MSLLCSNIPTFDVTLGWKVVDLVYKGLGEASISVFLASSQYFCRSIAPFTLIPTLVLGRFKFVADFEGLIFFLILGGDVLFNLDGLETCLENLL